MLDDSIRPGDFVSFELESSLIWKVYLVQGVLKDDSGEVIWHEIQSGDVGIVIDASGARFGTVVVVISRLKKLLKIHTKRLRRLD